MKPVVDQSKCISCGVCAQTAPEVFAMGDDSFAEVIEKDGEGNPINFSQYKESIAEAIVGCPAEAISDEDAGEGAAKDENSVAE